MGLLWSRFKRKPGTKDLLEDIEKKIRGINEYKHTKEKQQKRLVGAFTFYSCLFYVLAAVITYVWYCPDTLQGQLLCSVPLVAFPLMWVLFLLRCSFISCCEGVLSLYVVGFGKPH